MTLSGKGQTSVAAKTRSRSGIDFPGGTVSENARFLIPYLKGSGGRVKSGFSGRRLSVPFYDTAVSAWRSPSQCRSLFGIVKTCEGVELQAAGLRALDVKPGIAA